MENFEDREAAGLTDATEWIARESYPAIDAACKGAARPAGIHFWPIVILVAVKDRHPLGTSLYCDQRIPPNEVARVIRSHAKQLDESSGTIESATLQ